ncbi:MAG: 16S rRNA (adenine(1518)-N(6)/adenine(1519)-N(6))-dimethyltransferase RsmA [Rickettsiales bacterium]|nr:16S rRNA (adenine(1518)-N(6)/adenine(1519)-N(6))-dimethyltransferase RsmA [Rickettsiales bacterium]
MADSLPPIEDVIRQHRLLTKKSLGQHFLLDSHLTDQIVALAGDLSDTHVIEIGPGPGGLSRSILAAGAKQLTVIEKDARCIPILQQIKSHEPERFHFIDADALTLDLTEIASAPRAIIANLPYNVGTDMLLRWLDKIASDSRVFSSLTLMFQKEVAERVAARLGTSAYGRLSIFAQWLCHVELRMLVPAEAFSPPPKVDSAIVQLVPREVPLFEADKSRLEKVVQVAFQQRRKMLRSALKPMGADFIAKTEDAGIDVSLRAEQLSPEQFGVLARIS